MPTATIEAPITIDSTSAMDTTHRCDLCGAQAYVEVGVITKDVDETGLPKVVPLLFCGHHFADNEVKFAASSYTAYVNDERARLVEQEQRRTAA